MKRTRLLTEEEKKFYAGFSSPVIVSTEDLALIALKDAQRHMDASRLKDKDFILMDIHNAIYGLERTLGRA